MDYATKRLTEYVKEKGISVSVMSRETGIPYNQLYSCFAYGRPLRADEFLRSCLFLEKNPYDFNADRTA